MVRRRADGHAADDVAAEPSQVAEAEVRLPAARPPEPRQHLLPQLRPAVPHLHPSPRQFLPPLPPLLRLYAASLSLSPSISTYVVFVLFIVMIS